MTILTEIANGLLTAFFMLWGTLWALVFGFALSGAVQAFVSRGQMQKYLGDHRPKTIARAGLFGIISSSCSYAAAALAKSLFQKGAAFVTAMVFMLAATNLVVELGLVLWTLIGWQFAVAEFVGGAIMIILFTLLAPLVFPTTQLAAAREALAQNAESERPDDVQAASTTQPSVWQRMRSRSGWADAAGYAISDLKMLRRELVIGYVVAGVLAVAVPASIWHVAFFSGHGFWSDLENVLIGPFIAFISFVCSVGNVPLAAALYANGLSFGGTIAFIFADLIALPLVLIYIKLYGRRIAWKLFALFWVVMSAAGLLTDLLFRLFQVPVPVPSHTIVSTAFHWNYTTWLNIAALALATVLYWLYRNRERFSTHERLATDYVCGMQVEIAHAPATHQHRGEKFYFCSDRCEHRFAENPSAYAGRS